jgi:hypothetical protein
MFVSYALSVAVDCGTVVNPDTVRRRFRSAIVFGITAAIYGEITLKDGRVEQTNFEATTTPDEAPAIEVYIVRVRFTGRVGEPDFATSAAHSITFTGSTGSCKRNRVRRMNRGPNQRSNVRSPAWRRLLQRAEPPDNGG